MPRKKTTEEFIAAARKVHGDKYDYSLVDYTLSSVKVDIVCRKHGDRFSQTPNNHLRGAGCVKCTKPYKLTLKEFVVKAKKVHGDKYDYSITNPKGSRKKIEIICPKHSVFKQWLYSHLEGQGCPECAGNKRKSTKEFIVAAKKVHKSSYCYSLVEYHSASRKVKIKCRECSFLFWQTPNIHLRGHGCPRCAKAERYTSETFAAAARKIHGNQYQYSKVNYKKSDIAIEIICNKHGSFLQTPTSHLSGNGCSRCKSSQGENRIAAILEGSRVFFETQKRFEGCRIKRPLPFDFYIPSIQLLIEYDGEQHFVSVKTFGGEKALKEIKRRDNIKTEFAAKYGYKLLRIKYTEYDLIEEILANVLKEGLPEPGRLFLPFS